MPSLYMAAVRWFGSYDQALAAAAINPENVRLIKKWTRARVVRGLREFQTLHGWISYRSLHRADEALLSATRRFFGTFTQAAEELRLKTTRPAEDRQGWLFLKPEPAVQIGTQMARRNPIVVRQSRD